MASKLVSTIFDPWKILADHEQNLQQGAHGACNTFVGTMRDFNVGNRVSELTLEHYPEMTQQYLDKLLVQTITNWNLTDALLVHRYGVIKPGEAIVLIATWSTHRKDSFASCQHLIEALKKHAPFWKKETTTEGERWVHDAPRK